MLTISQKKIKKTLADANESQREASSLEPDPTLCQQRSHYCFIPDKNEIPVTGLKASNTYPYSIRAGETALGGFRFKTAPPAGAGLVKFAYCGDSREGRGGLDHAFMGMNMALFERNVNHAYNLGADFFLMGRRSGDLLPGFRIAMPPCSGLGSGAMLFDLCHAAALAGAIRLAAGLGVLVLPGVHAAEPPRLQSQVKGLLVIELDDGSVAGTASQMNATAVSDEEGAFSIGFNQEVGRLMTSATSEVAKFIRIRHRERLPLGYRVELGFADKYSPKDGPSAALVCALLVDSIITGDELDPDFAATGDMTATGEVRPVGGIMGKIRAASKKGCPIIGLPAANSHTVSDLYIMQGIAPLHAIQIFSLENFDEARKLGIANRDRKLQSALDEFALVRKALERDERFATHPKVRAKLKKIVDLAPNHLSARVLYLHSVKRGPSKLSLAGSIMAIDEAAASFGVMMEDGSFLDTGSDDVLAGLVFELRRLRPMLDPRTKDFFDAYVELSSYVKEIRSRRIINEQIQRELRTRSRRVVSEERELLNNEEVREELMLD